MAVNAGDVELNTQEVKQLVHEINQKGCQLCCNALALGSGRRVCSKGLTFPKCYNEGKYRLEE